VNVLVVLAVVLVVLLVALWLALATGLVDHGGSEARPNWRCVDNNLSGAPPPCAYPG
jgi:hypothetical protein